MPAHGPEGFHPTPHLEAAPPPESLYRVPENKALDSLINRPERMFFRVDDNGVALGLVQTRQVVRHMVLPDSPRNGISYTHERQVHVPPSHDQLTPQVEQRLVEGQWTSVVAHAPTQTHLETHMALFWKDKEKNGKKEDWQVVFDDPISPATHPTRVEQAVNEWRDAHRLRNDLLQIGRVVRVKGEPRSDVRALIAGAGDTLVAWHYRARGDVRHTVGGFDGFTTSDGLKDFETIDDEKAKKELTALRHAAFAYVSQERMPEGSDIRLGK